MVSEPSVVPPESFGNFTHSEPFLNSPVDALEQRNRLLRFEILNPTLSYKPFRVSDDERIPEPDAPGV